MKRKIQIGSPFQCPLFDDGDWGPYHVYTPTECEKRVWESSAFISIIGHWYGSIPPGCEESITHREFLAAHKRFKDEGTRWAMYFPEPGSKFDQQLRRVADGLWAELDPVTRERNQKKFEAFRSNTSWRGKLSVRSEEVLLDFIKTNCDKWSGRDFPSAARGQVEVSDGVTDAQLGRLGRGQQLREIGEALARLYQDGEPAVALLARGKMDSGFRQFLAAVQEERWTGFEDHLKAVNLRACGPVEIETLIENLSRALGVSACRKPEDLAEAVWRKYKKVNKCAIVNLADQPLRGGVAAFHRNFWAPFRARLRELQGGTDWPSHVAFLVTAVNAAVHAETEIPLAVRSLQDKDYSRMAQISELGEIEKWHVVEWIKTMPRSRRRDSPDKIATMALQHPENPEDPAQTDPTPAHVLQRLRNYFDGNP